MPINTNSMNTTILLSYCLLFFGVVVWAMLIPGRKHVGPKAMEAITVFGGAFLLGSCFINLVPHIFLEGFELHPAGIAFKVGGAVLAGFIIQLLLEQLTKGIEHGHNHCPCCEDHESHHHHEGHCHQERNLHPVTGLLIGLSIHAFLEGMPMVDVDGDIHQGLLYGIVLHNIPIALVMVGLFLSNRYSFWKSLGLLTIFAVMTPLGSLCNIYLLPENETLQCIIMGVVVGILLHVSVSILFDQDHYKFSWGKFLLIVLAFIAAYYTPGCPEIYGCR